MSKIELPKKGQVVRIKALREGFRRAGVAHSREATDHAHDRFTPAQLEALHGDPNLVVSYADAPQDASKPTDKTGK